MMYAGTILSGLCSGTYEAAEPLCVVSLRARGSMCSYCVVCSYYEFYGNTNDLLFTEINFTISR